METSSRMDGHPTPESSPDSLEKLPPNPKGDNQDTYQDAVQDVDEELQGLVSESWSDEKWIKGALIGQGSFSHVYLAIHTGTGKLFAVRQVEICSLKTGSDSQDETPDVTEEFVVHEISLLRDLHHPNLVQYLGYSRSSDHLNIFLEYIAGGSLRSMLDSYGSLPGPLVRDFTRQMLAGLAYLHGRGIVHRDIKGANILCDSKGAIKISDFGFGDLRKKGQSIAHTSSLFWMAPEVVAKHTYGQKADIWALGCVVLEMMTSLRPFPEYEGTQVLFKLGEGARPDIPDTASPEVVRFLEQTFQIDPEMRPTAEELMMSGFLSPVQ